MKLNKDVAGRRVMNSVPVLAGLALAFALPAPRGVAQVQPVEPKHADPKPSAETYQTLYLTNLAAQSEINDVITDLRNMIPKARLYSVASQNAISINATPDDIALAQRILSDLDRPRKIYRITYTITEIEGGKRIGTEHFSLVVTSGGKTILKQGSRVPVFVGTNDATSASKNPEVQYVGAQVQYQDVGLMIEANVDGYGDAVRLHSHFEKSSVGDEKSGFGPQNPVLHQTTLDETSTLINGKPFALGSLDIQGSTHRQEIEVVSELVK